MKPCELKSTAAWKSIKKGKKRWCDGCGVTLKYKKKNLNKKSKWWRAYCCIETGREMIFHNRLCVKFRKAKEEIRNSVTENDLDFADHHMGIDFVKDEKLDVAFRPKKFWTTFDESQKRRVKYRDTIRFGVVVFCKEIENEMNGLNMEEHDVNELNETEPTDFTNAVILIFFKICLAIEPATTLHAVSLAELLPPPL